MKKKYRQAFGHYVRWIADEIGLRDWRFEVEFEDSIDTRGTGDKVWWATCDPVPGRRVATLKFNPGVCEEDPEDLRETVVHELLHCHHAALWDQLRRDLLSPFGQDAYDMFIASAERNLEFGVDAIAVALAKHMPLIDWKNRGDEETS